MKKIIIGFLAGIICGLFGTGGGLILVPTFIHLLKLEDKKARGTSTFCIFPMVIVTSIFYYKQQYINWKVGLCCALGGIIGAVFGTKLLQKIPTNYVRILFIIFLLYVSIRMLL